VVQNGIWLIPYILLDLISYKLILFLPPVLLYQSGILISSVSVYAGFDLSRKYTGFFVPMTIFL